MFDTINLSQSWKSHVQISLRGLLLDTTVGFQPMQLAGPQIAVSPCIPISKQPFQGLLLWWLRNAMCLQDLVSAAFTTKKHLLFSLQLFLLITRTVLSYYPRISKENKATSSLPETAFRIFPTINHRVSSVVQSTAFFQTGILKFL